MKAGPCAVALSTLARATWPSEDFDLHSHVWAVERIDALERIIDQAAGCKRVGRINFDVELHRQTDAEKGHVVTRNSGGPFLGPSSD